MRARARARRLWPGQVKERFTFPTAWATAVAIATLIALVGWLTRSLMAVSAVAVYAGLLATWLLGARRRKAVAARAALAGEAIAAYAADLRAGAAPKTLSTVDPELDRLVLAADRLAAQTGAPLADLLDRVESHRRALARLEAAARAQTAGARLTVLVLAVLPVAGVGLGYLMGADPLAILLHTETGWWCLGVAVLLQLGGLFWTARLHRLAPPTGELPLAAELISAALQAGVPVSTAVASVGAALAGELAERLAQIGFELRLGAPAGVAWRHLDDIPGAGPLIEAARRSSVTGAALSQAFLRCAQELRADAADARQARLQRASVLLVLPLGLCFLPAFVFAGLVPTVFAVLRQVL